MIAPGADLGGVVSAFAAPVYALPLDAFRILAGLVSVCYFGRTLLETRDFSDPDGVIDHRLARRIFPPTRLGAFHPGLPAGAFRAAYLLACVASACVALGWQVKPAAAFLFVVAVSAYRWNFVVMYVDDAIMHLVLFWLLVLPVGHTLTLQGWLRDGGEALASWSAVAVPGGAARCFLANLALAYLVAGAYKWTSPMWRAGSALHAILRLPIARAPDYWRPSHAAPLRLASLGALALEPLFPLMFVLPAGSLVKWLVVASVVAFHAGIVTTLRIPFANVAMLGAIPIVLRDEIMLGLLGRPAPVARGGALAGVGPADALAITVVGCLALMVLLEVRFNGRRSRPPLWKTHVSRFRRDPAAAVLWALGIAQSYRLLDWIDDRNYRCRYELLERVPDAPSDAPPRAIAPDELFPRSVRHVILQSYLHGSIWLQIDATMLRRLRRATLVRYARRFARRRGTSGVIEVFATVERITTDDLDPRGAGVRRLLMRFSCAAGEAVVEYVSLTAEPAVGVPGYVPGGARPGTSGTPARV
jgi:hypothetical protein